MVSSLILAEQTMSTLELDDGPLEHREVRLGTASLVTGSDGKFIDVQRLNFKRFAKRPALAMVRVALHLYATLCDIQVGFML